jgi:hypothetical protein
MKFNLGKWFTITAILLTSTSALAQTYHNIGYMGVDGAAAVGLDFMTSKAQFETKSGSDFDLERKIFGLDVGLNMGDGVAVYGSLGRIMSTEWSEFRNFKGEGFVFGFGAKTEAYTGVKGKIVPYAQFNYVIEDLEYKATDTATTKVKAENSIYEFVVGSVFVMTSNPRFSPYAGFEIFPINSGEIKFKEDVPTIGTGSTAISINSRTFEFNRDDVINLKFGASAAFGNFMLRGEAIMISETTFMASAGFLF